MATLAVWRCFKPNRKRGIGDAIMRAVIETAAAEQLPEIYSYMPSSPPCRFTAVLGLVSYGEEFLDADMPHIAMKLRLA